MRRFRVVRSLIVASMAVPAMGAIVPVVPVGHVNAVTRDYEAICSLSDAPTDRCIEFTVLDKAFTDARPPAADLAHMICIRGSGANCTKWQATSNGSPSGGIAAHTNVIGDCLVWTDTFIFDEAAFQTAGVHGYNTFLDADCNGVEETADRRFAPGSITSIYVPRANTQGPQSAVLVNLTMADGAAPGYITADRCSNLTAGPQQRSAGNFDASMPIANLAVVSTDPAPGIPFCIYNQTGVNLIVDRIGTFAGPLGISPLLFVPHSPTRLLDTRQPKSTPSRGSITRIDTHAAPGTESVLVNLTMTGGEAPGFITADKCSAMVAGPQTKSSGNHGAAGAIANLAVVQVDPDGSFCIFNQVVVDLVVDFQGSFIGAAPDGVGFTAQSSSRVMDTRLAPLTTPTAGSITRVDTHAPAGTVAVLVNLAMTGGQLAGYITADKCSSLVPGPQDRSSGNFATAVPISNLSVVPVDPDGSFCIYNSTPVDLVVDIQGSFSPSGLLRYFTEIPKRLFDSRVANFLPTPDP